VFARAGLADWLRDADRPFTSFEDFGQVRAHLEQLREVRTG
jgi:2-hydroxy-3-keto-5-methylthiopentenyl-1-phosphate phosphatase